MLQPPFLDRCRRLGAVAVYVEANSTHLLNSAYGNPRSEVMNPRAPVCLPLEDATGSGGKTTNVGVGGGADFDYSGAHTAPTDLAPNPGWVDPITSSSAFADAYLDGTTTRGNALVEDAGSGIGFWYIHSASGTVTAHTGMHAFTVSSSGGFVSVDFKVSFADDAGCRKPTATVKAGGSTVTLAPDHDLHPWSAYGQDNDWHHIAVTENGSGRCKLYIDGLLARDLTGFGFAYTDDDATANWTIGINATAGGADVGGASSNTRYSFATVYSGEPSALDIARIVHSFRRPLDIEIDATVSARALTKPDDGGIERCDHGYVQPIDLSVGSGTPDCDFRLSDWRLLEHAMPVAMVYAQAVFLFHRLLYDETVGTPADQQGVTRIFNLEGVGDSSWDICGGTHAASSAHTEKDSWYVERNNRGWKLGTSCVDSGLSHQYHEFQQDGIYPAATGQEYESVLLMHEVGSNSTLEIWQGDTDKYSESSPPAIRFGTQSREDAHGGVAIDRGSFNDAGRYGSIAVFRDNLTTAQYLQLRRLTLGQAQLRSRPGLRALNRHFTQNAPSRVQGFIQ
jgi:hypothetical protein